MGLIFIENDEIQLTSLGESIREFTQKPNNLKIQIFAGSSEEYVTELLNNVQNLAPAFFFIDPYGHPFSMDLIQRILKRPRTEVFINFMFYQINRDISNPLVKNKVEALFGTADWANEEFVNLRGQERERAILDYYVKRTGAKYFIPFTIKFGQDEGPSSQQTKYYLIHATNHILGLQKMVDTMWKWSEV